ncbi:hypothetical protein WME70_28460, partial [Microcoleus anatoxicus PTRS1]
LLTIGLRKSLDWLEYLGMRGSWRWLRRRLLAYSYLRGVMDSLPTRSAVASFMQSGTASVAVRAQEIEIDLQEGWLEAERIIDEKRPDGVHLRYGEIPVGHIAPKVGMEPLRGVHLRPILANTMWEELLGAIALNGMPKSAADSEPSLVDNTLLQHLQLCTVLDKKNLDNHS